MHIGHWILVLGIISILVALNVLLVLGAAWLLKKLKKRRS